MPTWASWMHRKSFAIVCFRCSGWWSRCQSQICDMPNEGELRLHWSKSAYFLRKSQFIANFYWKQFISLMFFSFQCANSLNISLSDVTECLRGPRGIELQLNAEKETHLIRKPYPSFIPTIVYNQVKYSIQFYCRVWL